MTWLQFTLWLAAAYACYYILMILFDSAKTTQVETSVESAKLISFEDVLEPVKVPKVTIADVAGEPPSIASGGVNLKGLFQLALTESIHYTAGVNF